MADIKKQEEDARREIGSDRDQVLKDHILKDKISKELNHSNSHLGTPITKDNAVVFKNPTIEWAETDKFRIAMIVAPSWGILFPPYNVAKLTSLLRGEGYSVKAYDINIECYHRLIETTGEDYWRGERFFYWVYKNNFIDHIFNNIKPILDKVIDDIIESKVKVVGFSIYNTNFWASLYMARMIKFKDKSICIIAGGPETITGEKHFSKGEGRNIFNYIFVGESEEELINFLNNFPEELESNKIIGSTKSRLALEKYPYPDYSDYNLDNYLDNGISMETSRGCVAQCSFCAETYFWSFRSLSPERIVDEIEYQVEKHSIQRIWFVDSLINGNLKHFQKTVDLINERGLRLSWNSYARCDGRMDKKFFEKIKQSGATSLSFGVESGSQKVLDDMRKKVKIWEIEHNLRDCSKAGVFTHVNWMVGFATEDAIDHFHSMQLLFNVRKHTHAISPGMTAGLAEQSHSYTNFDEYDIIGNNDGPAFKYFLNQWATKGLKNTVLHRFLRLKMFHMWMKIIGEHKGSVIQCSHRYDIEDDYKLSFEENLDIDTLPQDFKVNFYQFNDSLSGTIGNEYVAFCYMLSRYFKGVHFEFTCEPKSDLKRFGDYLARDYTASVVFDIDKNNYFTLEIKHKLDKHFDETLIKKGHIRDWQTKKEIKRETIHERYR